ncbi:MAG: glycerate kinase type-2 family protein [Acidobacteriota bacterium]
MKKIQGDSALILKKLRRDALLILRAALDAAHAGHAVSRSVDTTATGVRIEGRSFRLARGARIWVVGAGKASATMARALETILGRRVAGGVVVTKYGHAVSCRRIKILEASHPEPDAASVEAGRQISQCISEAAPDDLVLVVLSGGGSALMELPRPGLTLAHIRLATRAMLRSEFTIHQINAVRKHLSAVKGGGLARHCRATMVVLALSDVIGDRLASIASGPAAPDPTTFRQCAQLLAALPGRSAPRAVREYINRGAAGLEPETLKRSQARVHHFVIGSNRLALDAARRQARRLGYRSMVLTSALQGDNAAAADLHARLAARIASKGRPLAPPACVLSGGETTLVVRGDGKGGRNLQFALEVVQSLAAIGSPAVVASLGTDGTDGPTDVAGALVDTSSLGRATALGLDPNDYLVRNDSYHFFEKLGDLIRTGPTQTNVMDLHLVLVGNREKSQSRARKRAGKSGHKLL